MDSVLPDYPIPSLDAHKYVRVPVLIVMGGPVYVDLTIRAKTDSGEPYETTESISIYG